MVIVPKKDYYKSRESYLDSIKDFVEQSDWEAAGLRKAVLQQVTQLWHWTKIKATVLSI